MKKKERTSVRRVNIQLRTKEEMELYDRLKVLAAQRRTTMREIALNAIKRVVLESERRSQ